MACFPPPLINTRKNEWKILGMQQKRKKNLNNKALKESTDEALNIMNKSFEPTYGISFEESLLSKSSNFEKKLCHEESIFSSLHFKYFNDVSLKSSALAVA